MKRSRAQSTAAMRSSSSERVDWFEVGLVYSLVASEAKESLLLAAGGIFGGRLEMKSNSFRVNARA